MSIIPDVRPDGVARNFQVQPPGCAPWCTAHEHTGDTEGWCRTPLKPLLRTTIHPAAERRTLYVNVDRYWSTDGDGHVRIEPTEVVVSVDLGDGDGIHAIVLTPAEAEMLGLAVLDAVVAADLDATPESGR